MIFFPPLKEKLLWISELEGRQARNVWAAGAPCWPFLDFCNTGIDLAEAGSLKDAGEMGGKKQIEKLTVELLSKGVHTVPVRTNHDFQLSKIGKPKD